jgi:hypothetical protein
MFYDKIFARSVGEDGLGSNMTAVRRCRCLSGYWEFDMPTIIGHHDVKDTKHWLASPKREELFGPLGVTNIRTFVDPQNPTRVAVLMDVPDLDAVMAIMGEKAAADAMEYDGVLPETLVMLVEAKDLPGT